MHNNIPPNSISHPKEDAYEIQELKNKVLYLESENALLKKLVDTLSEEGDRNRKGIQSDSDKSLKSKVQQKMPESVLVRNSVVLLVEDNFIAQAIAKSLLISMDCQVDVASNGTDAIALCEQTNYDIIFMDLGLVGGLDGYDVTHHIRSKDTAKHTPIIALTAHSGEECRQRCLEAGMDAVLTKPLTQVHAQEILQTFIPTRHEGIHTTLTYDRRDLPDSDYEMFQLNQFALLDREEALKNCRTFDMLYELLTLMSIELPSDLAQMKHAFDNKDYLFVEHMTHKIKAGAAYIGTTRMKYACQYVERYWKSGQRELFDSLYHQAVNIIEETITYIEGWLRR
jgi:CheY-like chemotaxis protein/HPt (histidine-containing phosphotransfer) domain-containing protein